MYVYIFTHLHTYTHGHTRLQEEARVRCCMDRQHAQCHGLFMTCVCVRVLAYTLLDHDVYRYMCVCASCMRVCTRIHSV